MIPPAVSAIAAEPDSRSIVEAASVAVPLPSVPVMAMPVLPPLEVSVAFSVIVPLLLTRNWPAIAMAATGEPPPVDAKLSLTMTRSAVTTAPDTTVSAALSPSANVPPVTTMSPSSAIELPDGTDGASVTLPWMPVLEMRRFAAKAADGPSAIAEPAVFKSIVVVLVATSVVPMVPVMVMPMSLASA